MDIDKFRKMRRALTDELRSSFGKLKAKHPDEKFLAHAVLLDMCDEAALFEVASLTQEKFDLLAAEDLSKSSSRTWTRLSHKWFIPRWYLAGVNVDVATLRNDALEAAQEELGEDFDDFEDSEDIWNLIKAAMVLSMKDLDSEAFFGTGAAREEITLICYAAGHDGRDENKKFQVASASLINPKPTFDRFLSQTREVVVGQPEEKWLDKWVATEVESLTNFMADL